MARYALRNQDKIAKAFGDEYLRKHIIASLDQLFTKERTDSDIALLTEKRGEESFLRLAVNDVTDEDQVQEFAIIGRSYDVYRLAYIGRIKL